MTEEENIKQQMEAARPDFENQPQEPEFLKSRKWFGTKIDKDFLDFSKPYNPPRYTLEHKGVPFANIGDLHIVSGKPGNGKTNLMSQFMAAILSGKHGNTTYREGIPQPVVLYVDTEMSEDDTIAVKNRVCTLAGLPYDKPLEQFKILRLRDTEEAIIRWNKTLEAVWEVTQGMNDGQVLHLFLDGIRDIVEDYNDQKECQPIIRECMMLATHYDTSMWMVLHENPLVDKLVGTLGSITQRKVSEIFTVRKHKQSDEKSSERRADRPEIYFTVKQVKARGRDVSDWDFEVTTESGWGTPRELMDLPPVPVFKTKHTTDELEKWLTDGQSRLDWPAKKREFIAQIIEPNGIDEEWEQEELYLMALNRTFIIKQEKSEMKKGQASPRLKLNDNIIKPFGQQQDDAPF